MKKRPLLFILIVLFAISNASAAIPYPYRDYDLNFEYGKLDSDSWEAYADRVLNEYTVDIKPNNETLYPWHHRSQAFIYTAENREANVYRDAEYEMWTDEEIQDELKWVFSRNERSISFGVTLLAEETGIGERAIVDTSEDDSSLKRFVLETDNGKRYLPTFRWTDTPTLIGGRMWSYTGLDFPRYDGDVQIIDRSTKWIRLWYISDFGRVYFQFDFN